MLQGVDRRLAISFGTILLSAMAVVSIVASVLFGQLQEQEENRLSSTLSAILAESIQRVSFSGKYQARLLVEEMVRRAPDLLFISVERADGSILAHSDPRFNGKRASPEQMQGTQACLSTGKPSLVAVTRDGVAFKEVVLAYSAGYQQQESGVVRVGISLAESRAATNRLQQLLAALVVSLTVLGMLATYGVSRLFGRKMRELASQLAGILAQSSQAIAVHDAEGQVLSYSQALLQLLGPLKEGESLRQLLAVSLTQEASARMAALGAQVFDGISPSPAEIDVETSPRAAGGVRILSASCFAIAHDPQGRVQLACTVLRDVTENRLARRDLENRERQISGMIEALPQQIWTASADGVLEYVSQRAVDYFGRSAAQLVGQGWLEVIHPDDREHCHARWRHAIEHGEGYDIDFRLLGADGQYRWHVGMARPLKDAQGQVLKWFGSNTDISERKQAEQAMCELNAMLEARVEARTRELALARDEAEAASRAKSDFIASMSHEIRTPMNGVLGMVELLQGSQLSAAQQHYTRTIQASGKTLLTVINDILDFSKVEAGKLQLVERPFDLGELLEEITTPYRLGASRGTRLLASLDPATPTRLLGDAIRLQQVIANLLNNAFKFTDNGLVSLRITAEPAGDEQIRLMCSVSDTGIGISEQDLARLFQPFSQADGSTTRRYGGTGLGLVICQRLVGMMGGSISVQSRPGQGSLFQFEVLLRLDLSTPARPTTLAGRRLLCIDDDAAYLAILQEQARALGMMVDTASCLEQAITLVQHQRPDIITIDLDMPGQDGFGVERALAALPGLATTPRLLLTASCSTPELFGDRLGGFAAAYTKPASMRRLADILSTALGAERREAADAAVQAAGFGDARILVAEDNSVNRQVIDGMLKRLGLVAEYAQDGAEALAMVQAREYSLILMDCEMPVLDGYQATQRIRNFERASQRRPAVILALSAHALPEFQQRSLEVGMDGHLTKPISLAVLEATLHTHLPREHSQGEASPLP